MTSPSGALRVDRTTMGIMAPGTDSALLDESAELLAAVLGTIGQVDPASLADSPPAVSFDPSAGARTWRHVALPAPPPVRPVDSPTEDDLPWLPAADLAALVRDGVLSPAEVVEAYLGRVRRFEPRLNAFVTVTADRARAETGPARGRAAERAGSRLSGVPVGLKDLIDTAGVPTTCGSRMLASRVPSQDAMVWQRMRAEGAVLLGKLSTHEFAAGVTSENDHYGPVRNPWDTSRVAGGSSGGSAVAVGAGLVAAALGTDTGGSVRIPAGCCGVVGLKPTYATVPMGGIYPLSWSLDHVGTLARTVRDAALLLDVVAGTRTEPASLAGARHGLAGFRVGVAGGWSGRVQPAVSARFEAAVRDLARCGAEIVEIPLPDLDLLVAVNRVIAYAEGSCWHEPALRSGPDYGAGVRARMEAGRFLLAGEYLIAQRLRARICRSFSAAWRSADLIATPVLPCAPPPLGSRSVEADNRYEATGTAMIRFTGPFNLTGLPAVTVPSGLDEAGMPTDLQLVAPPYEEKRLCFAAACYEAATTHHLRRPACAP